MIRSCSFWAKFAHSFQCRPSKSKTSGWIKQSLEVSLLSLRNTNVYLYMLMYPNTQDNYFFFNYNLFSNLRLWERLAFY